MSICVEYSEEPSSTSGGRYQSVTTSLEYVLVGTDLALARPVEQKYEKSKQIQWTHLEEAPSMAFFHIAKYSSRLNFITQY